MRHRVTLAAAPEDTCYLRLDDGSDPKSAQERRNWLGSS